MPYVHCSACHHEYECGDARKPCDWCGAPAGRVLEKKTPLLRMMEAWGAGVDMALSVCDPDAVKAVREADKAMEGKT